jgi:hypothetical protein
VSAEEDLLAANERFYAAFSSRDMEAMEAAWSRSGAIACTHPGWMTLHGREEVLGAWSRILANPAQARVVPGAARAVVIGEGAGFVVCREFVAGSAIVATNLFTLEDGEWRVVHHHASPVFALPAETS